MKQSFEVSTRDGDGSRIIQVSGELDMESSPRLLEELRGALREASHLKIDLRDVSYVDSSGIAVLIQGYKLALKKNASYVLLDPSPQVMAVIELSQLRDFFPFETRGERG